VDGIQADGTEAAAAPTASIGSPSLNPDVQGTLNTVEVTSDVQAWAIGARANFGWVMLPWPGGANAWISRSSEFVSVVDLLAPEAERPRLRVYFTPGVFAVPAILGAPVVTATSVQFGFTGTPGFTYTVLRAPSVDGPWTPAGLATVAPDGMANFTDNAPLPEGAFYRVVHP
jgi:hypothetical protein